MKNIFYKLAIENINLAIVTLNEITDNIELNKMNLSITKNVTNAVHSIGDYYERIKEAKIYQEDDLLFKAFAYLNNQIKHDINLEIIHYPVYGNQFPISFPMNFGPPGVCWNNFADNGRKTAIPKREHYNEYLCNKNVESTLRNILKAIERIESEIKHK